MAALFLSCGFSVSRLRVCAKASKAHSDSGTFEEDFDIGVGSLIVSSIPPSLFILRIESANWARETV